MFSRAANGLAAGLVCGLLSAAAASAAAGPPPPPKSPTGKTVTQVAAGGGLATPTSFAFGKGQAFEGDAGPESNGPPRGGVFVLKNGTGDKRAGSPGYVSGLAWHGGLALRRWRLDHGQDLGDVDDPEVEWVERNRVRLADGDLHRAQEVPGFNGIAFGPDGRLYVGVAVQGTNNNDHGPANTSPYLYSILTMKDNGKGLKVFATGIRQPWQMAFAPGSTSPFVSALGQDKPGNLNPPDFVLKVRQGDNYGFPQCTQVVAKKCNGYAKPFKLFAPHSNIMGMAIIGNKLYMTSFVGLHPTAKSQGGEGPLDAAERQQSHSGPHRFRRSDRRPRRPRQHAVRRRGDRADLLGPALAGGSCRRGQAFDLVGVSHQHSGYTMSLASAGPSLLSACNLGAAPLAAVVGVR
jgi:hypothetical protein